MDALDDTRWHDQYRRQMEVYQWLLRQNGLKVCDTGYFVYANGIKDKKGFDAKLEFEVTLIAYKGKDDWVEKRLADIKACLEADIPREAADCEHCTYARSRTQLTLNSLQKK